MNAGIDVERFVKEPNLLIELCREVIARIIRDRNDPEVSERETQLREIAKAIASLEKKGVTVPDALRSEKTRLAAQIGTTRQEREKAMTQLANELTVIVQDLNARLGRSSAFPKAKKKQKMYSRLPRTDKTVLREHIVQTLKNMGGRARVPEVIQEMGRQLQGKLLEGDLEKRESTGELVWVNNAKWERYSMTRDGILRSDSPRGYWELIEGQE